MALIRDTSQAQIAFQVEGGQPDDYSVMRYRGQDGVSRLFRFEIEVVTRQPVRFEDVVGKPASLSINAANGSRWFHGIVGRFELMGHDVDDLFFRVELVPAFWLLTHRYNCRIFQEKSILEIMEQVFKDAGIAANRFDFSRLNGTYDTREYCVQYRESDYNFCARLMEEAGIWWYFEQTLDDHVLVARDDNPAQTVGPIQYGQAAGMNVTDENVYRLRYSQSVRPGAVCLKDFNFENPSLDLQAKSDAGRDKGLEFSDFPGEYTEQSVGAKLAKIRMEEFEAGRIKVTGLTNSPGIGAGVVFALSEHPSKPANGAYLITSAVYEGKQATTGASSGGNGSGLPGGGDPTAIRERPEWLYHNGQPGRDAAHAAAGLGGDPLDAVSIPNLIGDRPNSGAVDGDAVVYQCRFECIPNGVTYRPPRVTPWPTVRGVQSARVVGPSGEEIYTDEYGRVKVQFQWDREGKFDDNSSCWIRVSQGMAGGQYGMMFLPRVGQEVVVDFIEGDPDRPIIVGRLFNKDHMPPYSLPDEKTKSVIKTQSTKGGGGTNEIRFEDLKGSEQILIHAEKDFHLNVGNDDVRCVGNDLHLTVENNKIELVRCEKHLEVKADHVETIGGNQSLDVGGDLTEAVGGNQSTDVGGNCYIKAGRNVVIEAGTGLTLKVGSNFVKIDASGITVVGTMIKLNSGGSAGSGSAGSTKTPEEPCAPDDVEPGCDVVYQGSGALATGKIGADMKGYEFKDQEVEHEKPTWVDVKLVDDEGNPVPYERCRVVTPEGKVIERSLNKDGYVRIHGIKPGTCEITFPDIDQKGWARG